MLGKFHVQRSLMGYSPWGCKESDLTKHLTHVCTLHWHNVGPLGRRKVTVGDTHSIDRTLSISKGKWPEMWGWLVFMGWVILWANKRDNYSNSLGEGVVISRNWGTTHSLAFYGHPWNCHGTCGHVIYILICCNKHIMKLMVHWKSHLPQSWTWLILTNLYSILNGYVTLLKVVPCPLSSCLSKVTALPSPSKLRLELLWRDPCLLKKTNTPLLNLVRGVALTCYLLSDKGDFNTASSPTDQLTVSLLDGASLSLEHLMTPSSA